MVWSERKIMATILGTTIFVKRNWLRYTCLVNI